MLEHSALLSLIIIRPEAIDKIVVVQHVDHGNRRVGPAERVRAEDLAVVVEVEPVNSVFLLISPVLASREIELTISGVRGVLILASLFGALIQSVTGQLG